MLTSMRWGAMSRLLAAMVLLCAMFAARAQDATSGFDFESLSTKAEQGDPWAQLNLGAMYDHGLSGIRQDRGRAVYWYRKSAQQGHPLAQFNLGHLYALGEGVEVDYGQALMWLRKAGEQDVHEAQYLVGVIYNEGLGTDRNVEMARHWLQRSIDGGEAAAREYWLENFPAKYKQPAEPQPAR